MSPEELSELGELIQPLIRRGQSLNHICTTLGDRIKVSEKTLYNYIDSCAFEFRNIDLPKKVKYKHRREKKVLTKFEYRYRQGRTYEDFKAFIEANPGISVTELDTVKGKRSGGGKVLLTMIINGTAFMPIFIMPNCTQESVLAVFDHLTELLGLETFRKLFPVFLTDNGVEFKDPESLEYTANGCPRTKIFYCDPQASWQKPHVEKNHTLLRRIIPKSTDLNTLKSEQVHLAVRHVNSYYREEYGNKTPFEMMTSKEQKKLLSSLELSPIPPAEVLLKPKLLK
jgi:IS30 family transposase